MIPYHNPAPAYRAHVRAKERAEEQRRAADLRPDHEIFAEISAKHRPNERSTDGRSAAQCYEDLKNYIAANPLTAEQRAEDAAKEKERLRAINAPARARRAKVRAEAKAKRRAKAAATERRHQAAAAFAARNPRMARFLDQHGLYGKCGRNR